MKLLHDKLVLIVGQSNIVRNLLRSNVMVKVGREGIGD